MEAAAKTDERGALFVTADSEDPRFNQPYTDVREWRDEPADAAVFPGGVTTQQGGAAPFKARHLYVHGGFTGTDAKFSFCFPPEEEYQGRFFQATHQLLAGEEATPRNVAFALASGGYSVQTNMGGRDNPRTAEGSARGQSDTTIRGYRVNAEAAKFSRVVAAEIYGPHRTYGYLYGGSGGAYQTVTSAEMTTGVWDGFVPYVMGSPQSIPNCFTVRVNALRVLKDKWPSIIDAIEPGGSGDPYAGLNDEERTALEEATRTGFPPGAWFNYVPQGGGPLVLVASYVPELDPTYLDDFWSKPGYLGTDPTSSVGAARIQHEATVVEVISGQRQQLRLSSVPTGDLTAADVVIASGRPRERPCHSAASTRTARVMSASCSNRSATRSTSWPVSPSSKASGPATRSGSTTPGSSRCRPTTVTNSRRPIPISTTPTSTTTSGTPTVRPNTLSEAWTSVRPAPWAPRVRSRPGVSTGR